MSLIVHRQNPNCISEQIARELEHADLHYSSVTELLYYFWLEGDDLAAGIFGDSDVGCYEWFIWDGSKLTHSDNAFAGPDVAFRALFAERRSA